MGYVAFLIKKKDGKLYLPYLNLPYIAIKWLICVCFGTHAYYKIMEAGQKGQCLELGTEHETARSKEVLLDQLNAVMR